MSEFVISYRNPLKKAGDYFALVALAVLASQAVAQQTVTPASGSEGRQLFSFVTQDALGASSIQYAQFLFSKSGLSAANACYISYDPVANVFYLLSDDMTQWYGLQGGSANTVGNAQCTIYGATSGSIKAGTALTTNVDISFRSEFASLKAIYEFSGDASGNTSGWQQVGTWNDTGDPKVVELISLTPNSGTGTAQTFTAVAKDGNGATTIPFVEFLMTAEPIGSFNGNGCFIFYAQTLNTFFLLNDTATAWSGLVAGSASSVSNSQCTLNGLGSDGTAVGSSLTVAYKLTFSGSFAGTKQIYMQAADTNSVIEAWHQVATWSPLNTTTTMSFSPGSLTLNGVTTQNLALNLSAPAPAGLMVNLSSSNATVATVPATLSFGAGLTSVAVPVTGVSAGSVVLTAGAPNVANATASVTVTPPALGVIQLPASATVGLNQSITLQVTLPAPAPTGGVTVSLASGDTSTATVTPSVFIAARNTSPSTQPQVNGIKLGSASVTASAPGFAPGSAQVLVNASVGSSFFSPVGGLTINAGSTQDLTLNLSPAPASGLTVNLSSSDTSVATVPATVTYLANSGGVNVPVTGVGAGSCTITATTPNFGTAVSNVIVNSLNGVSVTWYGACWATLTLNGYTGNFQGIDFQLSTPAPVVVNGTLFFTPNCDPSQGTDNMNDFGTLTGSTHMVQGFSRHPDTIPTSAMYWIGNATTTTGLCPSGSLCSGCVTYNKATPNCSNMP